MAQADNSTGVGMAPQYTSTGSSIRQPSVNYQATVRLPDAPLENRVKEPKTDWVNYALSETGRAIEAYNRLSASQAQSSAKIDKEAIKQAEAEKDRAWRNQLARESSRIAESVRQGTMTIEAADTAYRALGDKYITAGYDEEKVSKVIGRQDAGVRSLVQSQYSQSLTKELDRQAQQANTFMSENPGFRNMSIAKVNSILQQIDNDMDNLARIQQRQNNYEPGSDDWYNYKALSDEIINKNTTMMVARHVGNLLEEYGNVTPNNVQEITNRSLQWATQNGISSAEAQAIINRCYERMGVDTLKNNWIDTLKISADSAKLATQAIMSDAKLSVMSIPGVAVYQELGGDAWKQAAMTSLSMNKNFQTGVEGIVNEVVDSVNRDYTNLPPELTGAMMQGTNNIYASGSSTPFTRASSALTTLRLVNQNNKVTRETADGNATIALNNLNGTSERLNITAIRRDAKNLKASDKPDMQMLGEKTEAELDKLDGNRIAAEFLTPNSPMYQTVNGLLHSLNASELRYDEDGTAFLSGSSGVLGTMGLALRGYGGEGSYATQLDKLNKSLEGVTPEVKKQTLEALGFKQAARGEVSALPSDATTEDSEEAYSNPDRGLIRGLIDAVRRTIDEDKEERRVVEGGAVTQSDDTSAINVNRHITDIYNEEGNLVNGGTTTSKLSSSSSQTYDVSYPAVAVEPESEEGTKLQEELKQIDLAIKGPEGSHDSLNDIIERYNRNGWDASIFEAERDRLLQRRHEIEKALYYDPADDTEPATVDSWLGRYANEYGVDARQAAAILNRESKGDAKAVSPAGAKGLMQLMPDTFEEVKKELGLPADADIFDPETNIRAGVYYFSKMMRQFDGDVNKALAAYNWGPGNVSTAIRQYGDNWFEGARTKGIKVKVKGKEVIRKLPKETLNYVSALGQLYA